MLTCICGPILIPGMQGVLQEEVSRSKHFRPLIMCGPQLSHPGVQVWKEIIFTATSYSYNILWVCFITPLHNNTERLLVK
jgi:hypothetical protein